MSFSLHLSPARLFLMIYSNDSSKIIDQYVFWHQPNLSFEAAAAFDQIWKDLENYSLLDGTLRRIIISSLWFYRSDTSDLKRARTCVCDGEKGN